MRTKQNKLFKTIILSDIHLGSNDSKIKSLIRFLKKNTCETLILNGDIIESWYFKNSNNWHKKDTRLIQFVLKMMLDLNTQIVYLKGNNDVFLEKIIPFNFGNIIFRNEYVLLSKTGKQYLVFPGDIYETICNYKWLTKFGQTGYSLLEMIHLKTNTIFSFLGLNKKCFQINSQKQEKNIENFEKELVKYAKIKKFNSIICGHIHKPIIKEVDNIEYLNSGDWIENRSALVENHEGNWELIYFKDTFDISLKNKNIKLYEHELNYKSYLNLN